MAIWGFVRPAAGKFAKLQVELLIDAWFVLADVLDCQRDWSDSEASRALDLLGMPLESRSGRTPIDEPEGTDRVRFRIELVTTKIEQLEALRVQAMVPLDAMDQRNAVAGDLALLTKPAKLVLRYERDAWRRFRDSIRLVQSPEPTEAKPSKPVAPVLDFEPPSAPIARARAGEPEDQVANDSIAEDRRVLLEQAAAILKMAGEAGFPMTFEAEPDWLSELELRLDREDLQAEEAGQAAGARLTERSQIG